MLLSLIEALSWFQPEATPGVGDAGGGEAVAPTGGCATQAGLLLVMMLVFYFLLIRPQQKRQKEQDSMLKSLRRGGIVRTSGGIRGEIVDIDEREVTLLIADRVKINVLRANVAGVDPGSSEKDKSREDKGKRDEDKDKDKGKDNGKDKDDDS